MQPSMKVVTHAYKPFMYDLMFFVLCDISRLFIRITWAVVFVKITPISLEAYAMQRGIC